MQALGSYLDTVYVRTLDRVSEHYSIYIFYFFSNPFSTELNVFHKLYICLLFINSRKKFEIFFKQT